MAVPFSAFGLSGRLTDPYVLVPHLNLIIHSN